MTLLTVFLIKHINVSRITQKVCRNCGCGVLSAKNKEFIIFFLITNWYEWDNSYRGIKDAIEMGCVYI